MRSMTARWIQKLNHLGGVAATFAEWRWRSRNQSLHSNTPSFPNYALIAAILGSALFYHTGGHSCHGRYDPATGPGQFARSSPPLNSRIRIALSPTLALFGQRAVYCAPLAIGADAEPKHVHPDWHCVGSGTYFALK